MTVEIVYETHSTSEDNELGLASGWASTPLSSFGRQQAVELGLRRASDGLDAVFTSDLRRAVETAELALAHSDVPRLTDWRLRECDYGELTRRPTSEHGQRRDHLLTPHPGGESWAQAVERVGWFLDELPRRWSGLRVLIIGHIATRWALWHLIDGVPLEELCVAEFAWQPGWEFRLA